MTNKQPFDPWWYYEMGKDAAKHPNREISNGAFAVIVIYFIFRYFWLAVWWRFVFGILLRSSVDFHF